MGPAFKDLATAFSSFELSFTITGQTGVQLVVMGAGDDLDGIKLQGAEMADQGRQVAAPGLVDMLAFQHERAQGIRGKHGSGLPRPDHSAPW